MNVNDWKSEMDRMLVTLECESTHSLRKINRCFTESGRPFDENFRQYFLEMSTLRLVSSFNTILFERLDESREQMSSTASALNYDNEIANNRQTHISSSSPNNILTAEGNVGLRHVLNNANLLEIKIENHVDVPIEIADSDDEDAVAEQQVQAANDQVKLSASQETISRGESLLVEQNGINSGNENVVEANAKDEAEVENEIETVNLPLVDFDPKQDGNRSSVGNDDNATDQNQPISSSNDAEEDDEEEWESMDESMSDNSSSDSDYTDKKVCVHCNKTNRNLFGCSRCYYKPAYFEDRRNKRRRNQVAESDSDEEVSAEALKLNGVGGKRRSSRRRAEASPPTNQRLSSSRRNHRGNDDLLLDNVTIHKLLDEVCKNVNAWPFLRPVSRHEVPDYHKIIQNPMDLAKVKSKLNAGQYTSNVEAMKDIQLIFANCVLYNQIKSEIYVAGAQLETYIVNRCKELNLHFVPSEMPMSLSDDFSSKCKRQEM